MKRFQVLPSVIIVMVCLSATAQAQEAASSHIDASPLDFTWKSAITPLSSTWLWWTDKPRLSFTVTPSYGTFLVANASGSTLGGGGNYLGVYGLDLEARYRIGFLPQLFVAANLGYQSVPFPTSQSPTTFLDAVAGLGLWFDLWVFSLRAWVMAGAYDGSVSGGSAIGANAFVGADLAWAFTPSISMVLSLSLRSFPGLTSFPVNQAEQFGLGLSYTLVPPKPQAPVDLKGNGLLIKDLVLKDLEAAQYETYTTNPIGTLVLQNSKNTSAKDVKVSVFVRKYMKTPSEAKTIPEVKAGQQTNIDLFALLDPSVSQIADTVSVPAEISVKALVDGKAVTVAKVGTLKILAGKAELVASAGGSTSPAAGQQPPAGSSGQAGSSRRQAQAARPGLRRDQAARA